MSGKNSKNVEKTHVLTRKERCSMCEKDGSIKLKHRDVVKIGTGYYSVCIKDDKTVYLTWLSETEIEEARKWK